jgi:hypothetical protein
LRDDTSGDGCWRSGECVFELADFRIERGGALLSLSGFGGVTSSQTIQFVGCDFGCDAGGDGILQGFRFGVDSPAEGFEYVERIGAGENLEGCSPGITLMTENPPAIHASENHGTGEVLRPGFHAVEGRNGAEFLKLINAEQFVLWSGFFRHFANVNRDIDNDHFAGPWLV